MKKLILLALLVLSINTFAQEAFLGLGFDPRNAIVGSNPTENKPALDIVGKCGFNGEKGGEFQVIYESFKKIELTKYALCYGRKIPIDDNISLSPMIEGAWIVREHLDVDSNKIKQGHGGVGIAVSARYKFNDNWGMELFPELLYRGDIKVLYKDDAKPWVKSFYVGVIYYIGKK